GRVMDDMPAHVAGIQIGDRVLAINGQPIKTWDELTAIVHEAPQRPLGFQIDRGGTTLAVTLTPKPSQTKDPFGRTRTVGLVGVAPSGAFGTYRVGPLEAVGRTVKKELEWTEQIGLSLWSLFMGRVSMQDSLTGPIGIVYMTTEAARMGVAPLIYLVSLFSLSLAIFNLFPIPVLDGGHLLFLALEKLRGRPVSLRIQEKATQVSLAALLLIAVLVCVNDIQRLGLVDKLREWRWRN
ncbi:MAG: RIP metalloprotease RseP, partial [Candidatus Omnitrophica bacterium]|nr:RIP metalloprotease RseP [Candidatus Omnitrophota bacterium]